MNSSLHSSFLFSPPSITNSPGGNLLAVLARYLSPVSNILQIRCSGSLLACDRDEEAQFQRGFEHCLTCMNEHKSFGAFSGSTLFELGSYISSTDIERSKRWLGGLGAHDLELAEFDSCIPFNWVRPIFKARFGPSRYDPLNRQQESFLRKQMLSVTRVRLAVRRFLFSQKPSVVFAAEGGYRADAVIEAAKDIGLRLILCQASPEKRVISLHDWQNNSTAESDLYLKDYASFRADFSHWPKELMERLDLIADFASVERPRAIAVPKKSFMAEGKTLIPLPHVDDWIWGSEVLIWGYQPSHKYTCKILQPKVGRAGMLSLQYHHEKSESWIQIQGISWALLILNGQVSTRVMRPGDIQNIEAGTIHRLMGLTGDCKVLEPSTPDAHAADKTKTKDVVRLHCVLGREVSPPRNAVEHALVAEAISLSETAIEAVERGEVPPEINVSVLLGTSGYRIPLS